MAQPPPHLQPPMHPEALRRALLQSAVVEGAHVEEALRTGSLWIRHAVVTWESSEGTILGHLVGLGVDATLLAHIAPDPHVIDALTAAAAEAMAQRPRESLCELRVHWNGAVRSQGAYRGDSLFHVPFEAALETYLEARGEKSALALMKKSNIAHARTAQGWDVTVITPFMISTIEHDFQAIADACARLLSGSEAVKVRVMRA